MPGLARQKSGSRCGIVAGCGEFPRQQYAASVGSEASGTQISHDRHAVELTGFDQSKDGGGDLSAAAGFCAIVIFAPDDRAAKRALSCVVVEWNARVVEKTSEALPIF